MTTIAVPRAQSRMAPRAYLTGATLALPEETITDGALLLEDGVIVAICPETLHGHAEEHDLEGDVLLPGLIDLHGDAIEREMEPRDRARLPLPHAVVQGDRKCALAGITTPFHALAFAGEDRGRRSNPIMAELARLIYAYGDHSLVDNRIHCRFEMTSADGFPYIRALIEEGICCLVSLNNHTPGQGQFADLTVFRRYMKGNYNLSDAEIDRILQEKMVAVELAEGHGQAMSEYCAQTAIPLASHDDEDGDKVRKRHGQGVRMTEFPLSMDAASVGAELGLHAIVGSPNVLRGGSLGSGESALKLIEHGLADCLCSDYTPSTLLPAVFRIVNELGWPLHRAAPIASANPARAAGLPDRGEIRIGKRADLIAVQYRHDTPVVQRLWSRGRLALCFS
jgi:alpha-D-ribose 1-methylphosphonate 5-triphosphate diphosphatase